MFLSSIILVKSKVKQVYVMNKDLTIGNPSKVLWRFCLPLFGSIVIQQIYNIADGIVAGKFIGENALAAVGNSSEVTLIFIAFAFGCNIGGSVVISEFFGAKKYSKMKESVYTSLISSGLVCSVLMIIGIFGCDLILNFLNTPINIYDDSKLYLDVYIYGLPFVFFYNVSTGIFSALGDSKTPFIFLTVSSITDIIMNVCFVKLLGMGVDGLAWSTFICQGASCIVSLIVALNRLKKVKCNEKPKIFDKKIFIKITKIAVPSILQQSFISIGNIFIQGLINSFGSAVIAGYSASVKLNNLVITSFTTIGNGISNYTAQNLGAEKPDRVREGFKAGIKMVWLLCLPLVLIYFLYGKYLINLFIENPSQEALSTGIIFLRIVSPFYFIISSKLVSDGILRGAGRMNQFMIATFIDLILRVVLAFILAGTILQSVGIWCAWPIGWIVSTLVSINYLKKST